MGDQLEELMEDSPKDVPLWACHFFGCPRRANHAVATLGKYIFSFGGFSTEFSYEPWIYIDVHIFNTETYEWYTLDKLVSASETEHCPLVRYGHTAVAYRDKIYIWGGRNDDTTCNKLFCFNATTYKWVAQPTTGELPQARDGHSACVIDKNMYIFGGYDETIFDFGNSCYALNLETFRWTLVVTRNEAPSRLDFHSAVAVGKRMYIYGGRSVFTPWSESYLDNIVYLDTETLTWTTLEPTSVYRPEPRRCHNMFYNNGDYIYMFGGFSYSRRECFNTLDRYNILTNSWQLVQTSGEPPKARRRAGCAIVNNKVFIFGGCSPAILHEGNLPCQDEDMVDNGDMNILEFSKHLQRKIPYLLAHFIMKGEIAILQSPLQPYCKWQEQILCGMLVLYDRTL